MFATVLPGVRELRAPLASGYAWVVAAYLVVHRWLPDNPREAERRFAAVFDLETLVGKVGVGVAVSLLAYLIGGLTIAAMLAVAFGFVYVPLALRAGEEILVEQAFYRFRDGVVVGWKRRRGWGPTTRWGPTTPWRSVLWPREEDPVPSALFGALSLVDTYLLKGSFPVRYRGDADGQVDDLIAQAPPRPALVAALEGSPGVEPPGTWQGIRTYYSNHYSPDVPSREHSAFLGSVLADGVFRVALYQRVWSEADDPFVLDRLLRADEKLYHEADRHRAEAELRLGLVPPGTLMVVAVVTGIGLPLVLGLVVAAALGALLALVYADGRRRLARAHQIVWRAVGAGLITTPTIDLLRKFHMVPGSSANEPDA